MTLGRQSQLSISYDRFAWSDSRFDNALLIDRLGDFNRPHLDRPILLDNIYKLTALPGLHCL